MSPIGETTTGLRRQYRRLRRNALVFVAAIGTFCLAIGGLALLGWMFDIPRLKSIMRGAVEMKANTAVALMLAGSSLLLMAIRSRDARAAQLATIGQALGVAVLAIGALTGGEYLFGWDLGIDEALVRDLGNAYNKAKGRMSPYSALGFTLAGFALAGLPVPRMCPANRACGLAVALIGVVSLMGYLWGARELMTDDLAPPVALHTAICFLLIGLAILVGTYRLQPKRGGLRFLLEPVELKVIASFTGALLLLVALGGLTYRAATEYALHSRRFDEVKTFRNALAQVYQDLADGAFAQRNYLLTGQAESHTQWLQAAKRVAVGRRTVLATARRVGAAELPSFVTLDQSVQQLLTLLEQGVRIHREQGQEAARDFVRTGAGIRAMAQVRQALVDVEHFEEAEEGAREWQMLRSQRYILQVTLLSLVSAAAVLGAVFLAIRREMTARARAERGLRRRSAEILSVNRFLESLVQNLPHMVFVKDARDLRFVRMNRAGERLIGVSQEQLVGRSDRDFFPPQEAEHFLAKDREVLARGEVVDIPSEEIHAAGGAVRVLHTKKIPLYDDAGRPTHLVGISEDVTDAREQQRQIQALNEALSARAEEVERVNRARSAFLATMSHEIRTPMNGMLGMLELLGLSPLDDKQRQALCVVSESGQSLLRIIDDILDFSKIEAGKLEVREEVASVATILREVCNVHSTVAHSKGLSIDVEVDPALSPAMWLDPLRLRQVLNNLVSNAVKFTQRGRIALRAELLEQREAVQTLRISVVDSGVGITPAEQEQLFKPFAQAAAGSGSAAGGTGLGLVISRGLAELMGGTLDMESTAGLGTAMRLVIPVRTASPALLPQPTAQKLADLRAATERIRSAPSVEAAEAEGTLVLLVDDHPVNRMLLEQQLHTLGYAVRAAPDGAQALTLWQAGRFGLVLTDCQMPGMTGYELARRIRALEAAGGGGRIPIIACTAMALPEERQRCLEAGMDDVLFKPVELRPMMEKLQRWLPLPEARSAVDLDFLEATWGKDARTLRSIVEAYARSAREDRAALRDAVARRELDSVAQAAHRMHGASMMVGARGLADTCELVNGAARAADWGALGAAMEAFEAEYQRLVDELARREGSGAHERA